MMARSRGTEVTMDTIPHQDSMILLSSSFFRNNPKGATLPSPQEVRSAHQKSLKGKTLHPEAPHIVRYPTLRLCVKYSQRVRLNEIQALCFLNRYLGNSFAAPEVYGWQKDGADTFLYMELIKGEPLDEVWHALPETNRQAICKELHAAKAQLDTLRQAHGHSFLGKKDSPSSMVD